MTSAVNPKMQKAVVIGCPGSGKSTFARSLSTITGLPLYHLDMIWHRPDRTTISREEFDLKLKELIEKDRWIIDGNYQRTIKTRLESCDTVFLLDYPVEICLSGVNARIGKNRPDMPWAETEFDPEFRQLILDFSQNQLPIIYGYLEEFRRTRNIIVFKSRQDSEKYLRSLSGT